jgi:hypothetical protein
MHHLSRSERESTLPEGNDECVPDDLVDGWSSLVVMLFGVVAIDAPFITFGKGIDLARGKRRVRPGPRGWMVADSRDAVRRRPLAST